MKTNGATPCQDAHDNAYNSELIPFAETALTRSPLPLTRSNLLCAVLRHIVCPVSPTGFAALQFSISRVPPKLLHEFPRSRW